MLEWKAWWSAVVSHRWAAKDTQHTQSYTLKTAKKRSQRQLTVLTLFDSQIILVWGLQVLSVFLLLGCHGMNKHDNHNTPCMVLATPVHTVPINITHMQQYSGGLHSPRRAAFGDLGKSHQSKYQFKTILDSTQSKSVHPSEPLLLAAASLKQNRHPQEHCQPPVAGFVARGHALVAAHVTRKKHNAVCWVMIRESVWYGMPWWRDG